MENAGTLPCAPEIPDCTEQVRAGPRAPPRTGGWWRLLQAALRLLVFLPRLRLFGVWGPRASLQDPLASKSRERFWSRSGEAHREGTAENAGAGDPHGAPRCPSVTLSRDSSGKEATGSWLTAGRTTFSVLLCHNPLSQQVPICAPSLPNNHHQLIPRHHWVSSNSV